MRRQQREDDGEGILVELVDIKLSNVDLSRTSKIIIIICYTNVNKNPMKTNKNTCISALQESFGS